MSKISYSLFLSIAIFSASYSFGADGKWECTSGASKREITVKYEGGEKKAPCQVLYKKDAKSEEAGSVLWSAANESSYCDQKASAFVEKISGMGWTCQ